MKHINDLNVNKHSSIYIHFKLYDVEYITLRDFIKTFDLNNTFFDNLMYSKLFEQDLGRGIRPKFKNTLMEIKKYVEECQLVKRLSLGYLSGERILCIIGLHMEDDINVGECMKVLFTEEFCNIKAVELVLTRLPELCMFQIDMELIYSF